MQCFTSLGDLTFMFRMLKWNIKICKWFDVVIHFLISSRYSNSISVNIWGSIRWINRKSLAIFGSFNHRLNGKGLKTRRKIVWMKTRTWDLHNSMDIFLPLQFLHSRSHCLIHWPMSLVCHLSSFNTQLTNFFCNICLVFFWETWVLSMFPYSEFYSITQLTHSCFSDLLSMRKYSRFLNKCKYAVIQVYQCWSDSASWIPEISLFYQQTQNPSKIVWFIQLQARASKVRRVCLVRQTDWS